MLASVTASAQKRVVDTIEFKKGGYLYKILLYHDSLQINGTMYRMGSAISAADTNLWKKAGNNIWAKNTGNVGIGVTNPAAKLHIVAPSGAQGFYSSSPNQYAGEFSSGSNYGINTTSTSSRAISAQATTGIGGYFSSTSGFAAIFDQGNVGIGITNPSQKLHVQGTIYATTSNVGVYGLSTTSQGVRGSSTSSYGVYGTSSTLYGVYGSSANESGIVGYAITAGKAGVMGTSTLGYGVCGSATTGYGGYFISPLSGTGLYASSSTGFAAIFMGGNVGIGTTSPTAWLDLNSDIIRLRTAKTPASASATGNAGDICWDADYIYVCTATDTWKRVAIASW